MFGISEDDTSFLSDNFWPMIIGQFGYIGTAFYIIILCLIYGDIQKEFNKKDYNIYISKIICFIYLIISSIAESAFVNPIAIPLALIMGLNTEQEDYDKMEGEKYYEKK